MRTLETVAARVSRGQTLSQDDAAALLDARDLIAVGMLGDEVRRRMHGGRTTFVRVFEAHVGAPQGFLPQGFQAGEYRVVGTPVSADAAVEAVRAAVSLETGVPVLGFSLADLAALTSSLNAFEDLCRALQRAGLAGVAETPIDRLDDPALHVAAARRAGLSVERLTVDDVEEPDRVHLVMRARDLQASLGGFRALAPLPRAVAASAPTTGYDDVKLIALARVLVTDIPSIQVDWRQYGPKLAQVALTVGADDVDGVDAVDDGALGTRRSAIAEIRANIRAAALEPIERDGLFQPRN